MMKARAIDRSTAEPAYLKIARYKPKEINRGNEKAIAAMNAHH
jgi:hypothetical protein